MLVKCLLVVLIFVGRSGVADKKCIIEGCDGKSRSKGMCERHFNMNWAEPTNFVNDPRIPFHWLILCYIERYYANNRVYPTNRHMMRVFNQRRAADIWERVQLLIERGYLKRDPSYRRGQTKAAIMLTNKRFDCSLLADPIRMEEFNKEHYPNAIENIKKEAEKKSGKRAYRIG